MYERTAALKVVPTLELVYHHLPASTVHSAWQPEGQRHEARALSFLLMAQG